jgi:predicted RNase H-like nuclease (RuvC/YqgF family)
MKTGGIIGYVTHNAFRQCITDIAERDARIAALDAEIAALRAECEQWREELRIYRETENREIEAMRADAERWRTGHDRYEVARKLNVQQWRDALQLNMLTGKPFDQIIDELRPFYFPAKANDAARGEGGGNG